MSAADSANIPAVVSRIRELLFRGNFAESKAMVQKALVAPDPHGVTLITLAEALVELASAHADMDPNVSTWLRREATSLLYAWGSSATSGGEGACRAQRIRAAEERLSER